MIYCVQTNKLLSQRWLKSPSLWTEAQSAEVRNEMQGGTGRRGEGLAENEINTQEMGSQENMFVPLWREYSKDTKEVMLHRCTSSSHSAYCRIVRKCLHVWSHSFAQEQPPGSERRKRWKMAANIQYRSQREGFYYALHLQHMPKLLRRIKILCLNLRALMERESLPGDLHRSVIMYSVLQRLYYEQDNPSLSTITFPMKSWCVSTLPSLERTVLLPDLFPGKHTTWGLSQTPPCHTLHRNL